MIADNLDVLATLLPGLPSGNPEDVLIFSEGVIMLVASIYT